MDEGLEGTKSRNGLLESMLEIKATGEDRFVGLRAMRKPDLTSRGVYGGYICAQSLIAAMKTIENGLKPHSLHSYFISAGTEDSPFEYEVERTSDGKSFANRMVRVYQNGQLRYIAMVSFTKKNSISEAQAAYNKEPHNPRSASPIHYQTPLSGVFDQCKPESLPKRRVDITGTIEHRLPPHYFDSSLDPQEAKKKASERELSVWMRINDETKIAHDNEYRYAGLAILTDSLHLSSLSRLLHLPIPGGIGISGGKGHHYFNVSLDHTIYFHDHVLTLTTGYFSGSRVLNLRTIECLSKGGFMISLVDRSLQ